MADISPTSDGLPRSSDISESYAVADALCRELSLAYEAVESNDPAFIEGPRGALVLEGVTLGGFGEVHPEALGAFGLDHPVAAVELDLSARAMENTVDRLQS